jgi:GH15 family glucan-1,4-alpha-glucosidase
MMNKSIALSPSDWETVIEGLSYACEEAEEQGNSERAEVYTTLIDQIAEAVAV